MIRQQWCNKCSERHYHHRTSNEWPRIRNNHMMGTWSELMMMMMMIELVSISNLSQVFSYVFIAWNQSIYIYTVHDAHVTRAYKYNSIEILCCLISMNILVSWYVYVSERTWLHLVICSLWYTNKFLIDNCMTLHLQTKLVGWLQTFGFDLPIHTYIHTYSGILLSIVAAVSSVDAIDLLCVYCAISHSGEKGGFVEGFVSIFLHRSFSRWLAVILYTPVQWAPPPLYNQNHRSFSFSFSLITLMTNQLV